MVQQIKASVKEKNNLFRNILRRTSNASFLKKLEVLQTKLQSLTEAQKVGYHNQISKRNVIHILVLNTTGHCKMT